MTTPTLTVPTSGIRGALEAVQQNSKNTKLHKNIQYKKLFENIKSAKASFQQIAKNGVIKIAHLPLTLHSLYFCLILEKMTMLHKQHLYTKEFHHQWVEINICMSKGNSAFFGKTHEQLKLLLESINRALAAAGICSKEFDETIDSFTSILKYPFIGNIALAVFFEKNGNDLKTLDLPPSAVIQSFQLQVRVWSQIAIPYLDGFASICKSLLKTKPDIVKKVNAFKKVIFDMDRYLNCLTSTIRDSKLLQERWLAETNALFCEVWEHWSALLEIETLNSTFLASRITIKEPSQFFVTQPLKKIEDILPFVFQADKVLESSKNRAMLLRSFPSIASLAPQPAPPKAAFRKPKSRKCSNKTKKNVPLETPTLPKSVTPAKEKAALEISSSEPLIVSLPLFAERAMQVYHYANLEHQDPKKRETLLHAAWHLEKLNAIREFLYGEIEAEDYLNILSAIAFHASHCLEQLCAFKILKKQKNLELYQRIHNLNILSKVLNLKFTPAIHRVYLGTFWARYPLEEHAHWNQSSSFHTDHIPDLLENLIELVTRTSNFTNVSFREYCEIIYSELEKALPLFVSTSPKNFPKPLTPLTTSFLYSIEPLSDVIQNILNIKKGASQVELKKLEQSILNIHMLKRTLFRMQEISLEQFTFFATRALFLVHESTDNILHALESRKTAVTTSHNLKELAEKLSLDLNGFGEKMQKLSHKLKYPFRNQAESTACSLVDKITSLRLHPNLEENFIEVSSIISYPLPLNSVSSQLIGKELAALLTEWIEAMNTIIKAMENSQG